MDLNENNQSSKYMKFIEYLRVGILSQSINDVYVPIQKKVMTQFLNYF